MGNQNDYSSSKDNREDERTRRNEQNERSRYEQRDNRRNENTEMDHNARVIEVIERITDRHQNYASAVKGPKRPQRNHRPERQQQWYQEGNGNLSRRSSFHSRNDDTEPIHERLALSKRNSRRNIAPTRHREHEATRKTENDKDHEILELKNQLELMERDRNQGEKVTNHYYRDDTNTNSKNETGAQKGKGPENNDLKEMKSYLKEVLQTINDFDTRLTSQIDSNPNRWDE